MQSATYKPKKLIPGSVIGKDGLYVAIPDKLKNKKITVTYNDKSMIIERWLSAEAFRRFPDKYGRGLYTLGYFLWE